MVDKVSRRPATLGAGDVVVGQAPFRCISWGGVFAGLFLVLAIQLLLSVLGFGIGLSIIQPQPGGAADAGSVGIGAAVWWVVTYLIALLIGSYAAARLAAVALRFDGILHGLVTWAFALLVTVFVLTTAVGGAFGIVGNIVSAAGQALKSAMPAPSGSGERLGQRAKELLQPTEPSKMTNEQADARIAKDAVVYLAGGSGAAQARDRIIGIMAAKLGISRDDAAKRFDQWAKELNQTKSNVEQGAKRAAGRVAGVVSQAAIFAFVGLLLGAIFSALGGAWGARPRTAVEKGFPAALSTTGARP